MHNVLETRKYGVWINGADERGLSPARDSYVRFSPSNGAEVATFLLANDEDVSGAATLARNVFRAGIWCQRPAIERGKVLRTPDPKTIIKPGQFSREIPG